MVKRLKCFRRFRVWKGARTFRKRFRSLLKYLWSFRVRKGAGNSEPPEPLCGSRLNTVRVNGLNMSNFSCNGMGLQQPNSTSPSPPLRSQRQVVGHRPQTPSHLLAHLVIALHPVPAMTPFPGHLLLKASPLSHVLCLHPNHSLSTTRTQMTRDLDGYPNPL